MHRYHRALCQYLLIQFTYYSLTARMQRLRAKSRVINALAVTLTLLMLGTIVLRPSQRLRRVECGSHLRQEHRKALRNVVLRKTDQRSRRTVLVFKIERPGNLPAARVALTQQEAQAPGLALTVCELCRLKIPPSSSDAVSLLKLS